MSHQQKSPLYLDQAPTFESAAVRKFKAYSDGVRDLLDGKSKEDQEKALVLHQSFIRGLANPRHNRGPSMSQLEKAVTPAMVHVDGVLSNFSKMYANARFIGELLMPVVSVDKRSDKYSVYPKRERLAVPKTRIGARGQAQELDETRETDNYSVADYALKAYVELETIRNQDAPLNEMIDAVEGVLQGLALDREDRILTILTTSGNYAGNTTTAGTNWNDSTGGTMLADIRAAISAMWTGRGPIKKYGFCPITVWNSGIAENPTLHERFKYTVGGAAVTTQVANYFGLDDILVTEAREDTANIGQTASYARLVTADVFGVVAVSERPSLRSAHFGSTFRTTGSPFTAQWTDPDRGTHGGIVTRTAVSEDHKVVAGDAGYYLTSLLT